jgi:hypothetical protein
MKAIRTRWAFAVVTAGMSIFLLRGIGVRADAPEQAAALAAKAPATPKELAKDQVAVARRALEVLRTQLRNSTGEPTHTIAEIQRWRRRMVKATRAAGDKPETIKVLKEYMVTAKEIVEFTNTRLKEGFKGLSDVDVDEARYRLIEAQRWLAEEQ